MTKRSTLNCLVILTWLSFQPFTSSAFFTGQNQSKNEPVSKTFVLKEGLVPGEDYITGKVIFKLKPEFRSQFSARSSYYTPLNQLMNQLGVVSFGKKFPRMNAPATQKNDRGEKLVDLSLVYEFTYSASLRVDHVINKILAMGMVEYAEPHYIPKSDYTPNDPNYGSQPYLASIQAATGWDIDMGNSSVVVAITDTGTDWDHPDLTNNIAYNTADPINGADDDNDGFTDNYRGWDVAMNDNDPQWQGSTHGVGVSGLAAASTDNSTGVASPAFNCKFLPVKIADQGGTLIAAYDGIVYAADQGCQVINCSWGGSGYSAFNEDVINYATFNKNALVVAAAGNTNADEEHYPGSYPNTLNVAGLNNNGRKGSYSTYGYTVDVGAPGTSSYSTMDGGSYGNIGSGTSYASPLTAGCAAVVKAHYPSYTALQVGERLRTTADNVDAVTGNAAYVGKLGAGMINLYRALSDPETPSVIMSNEAVVDNKDNIFVVNDTLYITATFTNYLAATSNLTATLSTTNGNVTIIDNSTTIGALASLASASNNADPWQVRINPGTPQNTVIPFKVTMQDGSYSSVAYFNVTVNVDYINVTINEVKTTVTSKGRSGYNLPNQLEGLGFVYRDSSLLYEGGLMIGTSAGPDVSDNVRGATAGGTDEDFGAVIPVYQIDPALKSHFDLAGEFNDNPAGATSLGAHIRHRTFAWNETGHTKYVILEYTIINKSGATWNGFHAGFFADWDIMDFNQNYAATDAATKLGYAYSSQSGGIYAGIRLLTAGPFLHYAIDNDGTGGGANIYDGYPSAEKYTTISTNRANAGMRDIASVVSSGPHTVADNDSIVVAFSLIAGDDLNDIKTSGDNSQEKYDGITTARTQDDLDLQFEPLFPNPADQETLLRFNLRNKGTVNLDIYSIGGQKVKTVATAGSYNAGTHRIRIPLRDLSNGSYYLSITQNGKRFVRKFVIAR